MTGEIIQFPQAKDPEFDGLGIAIDVEKWRKTWADTFASAQFAMRFCNFDHVEAERAVRRALDAGDDDLFNEMASDWEIDVEYLEAIIMMIKDARARLEVSQNRVTRAERVIWRFDADEYAAIKAQNPNAILFYRMGDFYELLFDDAAIAAAALGIVVTTRGGHEPIPMCSVPVARVEDYLNRLVGHGHCGAICE
ncbi:MAG: hypothetical protein ACREDT_15470, partial [Methylocella sp.]